MQSIIDVIFPNDSLQVNEVMNSIVSLNAKLKLFNRFKQQHSFMQPIQRDIREWL